MADFTNSPSPAEALLHRRLLAVAAPSPPPSLTPEPDAELNGDTVDFDPAMPWNADDALRREMDRLQASREFAEPEPQLSGFRTVPDPFKPASFANLDPLAAADALSSRHRNSTPLPSAFGDPAFSSRRFPAAGGTDDEAARLRTENEELNKLIDEMKQIFAHAAQQEQEQSAALDAARTDIAAREQLQREQAGQIELLTRQIHELEQHIQDGVAPPPTEDELSKMADELEKERCQLTRDRKVLDDERNQLREDEEDMMRQMREMEVQMAKERADLARQRTEVQRLHSEVKHELEQMQRGDHRALTDRLAVFQRRHQEVLNRGSSHAIAAPPPAAAPAPPPVANGHQKEAGLLGRFFGRK